MTTVAPYGSWRSPIEPAEVAGGGRRLGAATIAADGAVWWAEGRPAEGGRSALMRRAPGGDPEEVTPAGANVRTRVHEYGGGAWTLAGAEVALYVDFADQRLYRLALGGAPEAIVPEPASPAALRYADMDVSPDGTTVLCVREIHGEAGEPENQVVALPVDGSAEPRVLAAGRDFYSFPRFAPDGETICWTCWDHPNMPWDGTELFVATLDACAPYGNKREGSGGRLVAGGAREAVFAPKWDPDGRLHFVSDRDGFWNLYRVAGAIGGASDEADVGATASAAGGGADSTNGPAATEQLTAERADLGHPQWLFGGATYAFLEGGDVALVRTEAGEERLAVLADGEVRDAGLPYTAFGFPAISARGHRLAFAAAGPTVAAAVVVHDFSSGESETVRDSTDTPVDPAYVSVPRAIEFPTGDGSEVAHGFYYPPANAEFEAPDGERPPLIVESHGGPTSHVTPALSSGFLFWTSRGFGVVDVNYRGSSGYGREYRDRLRGAWGIVDTEDCIAAARFLAETGEVDGARLTIRGGSAGGYATLCALVFHDEFAAGASYYGVADTETLARDTHKFEARYLDGLIGPYPERADLYRERSPIHFLERLSAPVIIFQGLEDEIVPPNQAETMVAALEKNGIPHAYLAFEGEQHGFRKSETEIRCLEAELYFYGRILDFAPADVLEPVAIPGLD